MSWEQDLSILLQQLESMTVRFDIPQELNDTEKARAKSNMGITATATKLTGNDYKITITR